MNTLWGKGGWFKEEEHKDPVFYLTIKHTETNIEAYEDENDVKAYEMSDMDDILYLYLFSMNNCFCYIMESVCKCPRLLVKALIMMVILLVHKQKSNF